MQIAYADLEYQKASFRAEKAAVLYDVRKAFVGLLIAQENFKLLEEILDQRKDNSRMMQLRYESGREDKGNLLTTKAEQTKAEFDLEAAKRELALERLNLSQLLDQDVDKIEFKESVTVQKIDNMDSIISSTPLHVMYSKQLESAELSRIKSFSVVLPTISLSGSRRLTGDEWMPDSENSSWSWNISYPLFPGGSNIADLAISGAEIDKAKEENRSLMKGLRYDVEKTYYDLKNAVENFEYSKIALDASSEREKITQVKYLNGLADYDEWYRIENTFIQARKSLLNSKKDMLLAEAGWYKILGRRLK